MDDFLKTLKAAMPSAMHGINTAKADVNKLPDGKVKNLLNQVIADSVSGNLKLEDIPAYMASITKKIQEANAEGNNDNRR